MTDLPMHVLRVRLPERVVARVAETLLDAGAAGTDVSPVDQVDAMCLLRAYMDADQAGRLERVLRQTLPQLLGRGVPAEVQASIACAPIDEDWQTKWSEGLQPVTLIPGLVLVPEGTQYAARTGERVMVLEKGLVFGFGEHPTTRMASEWLAQHARGHRVLDVGSGTGVVAFVAAYSGASQVLGVDIDPLSVESALRNAHRNNWHSVCRFSPQPIDDVEGVFDTVVANIDAQTLVRLAPAIVARRSSGGTLALTGVLVEQAADVQAAYAAWGARLRLATESEGWVLLLSC